MKQTLLLLFTVACLGLFAQKPEALEHFNKAERLYNAQKYEAAITEYSKAIEIDNEYINAYLRRAFCYNVAGKYEEAIKDYDKIIELQPNNIYALNSRGSAKNKLKKYDEAIKDFNKVLSIDPKNQEAYNNRGWAYEGLGRHKEACADWKKSKKLGNSEAALILKNTHCK
jgi:tetratricopeptide (TPR) repeat protein